MNSARFCLAFAILMVFLVPARAGANTYTFSYCFSGSAVCDQLADQLQVEVTEVAGGKVNFEFTNQVGISSNIAELYFDSGNFLTNMKILSQDGGANFVAGSAQPPDPPGGTNATPPFETTVSLVAQATQPPAHNGLNSLDDSLTLQFKIATGYNFAAILAALDLGPNEGDGIRIAAHVTGLPQGQSETFICCGPGDNVVPSPEPAVLALFGMGLFAVGLRVRRKKSQ